MFAYDRFSVGFGGCRGKFLASETGRLAMMVLLFAGIVHATPMDGLSRGQLHNSKQMVLRTATVSARQSAESTIETTTIEASAVQASTIDASVPHLRTWTLGQAATAGCVFSGSCSSEVEVAEPQSLLLLGTGLLSMAGLIRRKLLQ